MRRLILFFFIASLCSCSYFSKLSIIDAEDILQTAENTLLVTGIKFAPKYGRKRGYIMCIDKNGASQWNHNFENGTYVVNCFALEDAIYLFVQKEETLKLVRMSYAGKVLSHTDFSFFVLFPECIVRNSDGFILLANKSIVEIDCTGTVLKKTENPVRGLYRFIAGMNGKYLLYGDRLRIDGDILEIGNDLYPHKVLNTDFQIYSINPEIDVLVVDNDKENKRSPVLLYHLPEKKLMLYDDNHIITFDESMSIIDDKTTDFKNLYKIIYSGNREFIIQSNYIVHSNNSHRYIKNEKLVWEKKYEQEKIAIHDGLFVENAIVVVGYQEAKKIDAVSRYGHTTNLYISCISEDGDVVWEKILKPNFSEVK